MTEHVDWSLVTWEGKRRQRREEFQRLSFQERVLMIEEMERVAAALGPVSSERAQDSKEVG